MKLALGTYNIHRCVGADGRKDPERVLRVLAKMDLDVVALQEVESRFGGTPDADQADFFARRLERDVIRGPTMRAPTEHYGNALLVRHAIDTVYHHDISLPGREPRAAIDVSLDVGATRLLRVFNTHLGLRRKERLYQVTRLLKLLREASIQPLVLAGDFNSWLPLIGVIGKLDGALGLSPMANLSALRTYPARFPLFALDRMWISPPHLTQRIWVYDTPESRVASDHLPLRAVLEV
jgi:endonuclease/exonuclease/phosphatase family metal-dependent hydrolase